MLFASGNKSETRELPASKASVPLLEILWTAQERWAWIGGEGQRWKGVVLLVGAEFMQMITLIHSTDRYLLSSPHARHRANGLQNWGLGINKTFFCSHPLCTREDAVDYIIT